MKIIHVVLGKANPERMNGVNKVAHQLAKTQHEMGYDVMVWGIANSLEHNYPPRDFRTELFNQLANKLRLDSKLVQAIRQVQKGTVVHIHGAFIPEFYLLSKLLIQQGLEYVYTPHGSFTEVSMKYGKWRKTVYFSLFERFVIKYAKAVQLLGEMECTGLDKLLSVPHKVLIPNGMDVSEIPLLPQKSKSSQIVFNYCGRLHIYKKGLDLMLEGFYLFLEKGHSATLELIGDGEDRLALEALVKKLGIGHKVVFHGAKYGDEKYRFLARGDVFLHTSRTEGFPMAVLEAASLGLPCLTSEPTNINQFIRKYDAGFAMANHNTPSSICETMETAHHFFQKNKLKEKGQNARTMVLQAFDWKNISRELISVYYA